MKKIVLTFILIIISSLAYSQADDNNLDSLIPKNITQDDIIFITSNNQNMKIENEDADIKDFWLAYFNDKENKIYNNMSFDGDEFKFNEKKQTFEKIKKKKYILIRFNMVKNVPEYDFKTTAFTFTDKQLFHNSFFRVWWFRDKSYAKPDEKDNYFFIPSLSMVKPIKIKMPIEIAKSLKQNTKKCELIVLYQITNSQVKTFRESYTKDSYGIIKRNPYEIKIKQLYLKPLTHRIEYLDDKEQLQKI